MDAQSVIDNIARTLIDEGTSRRWAEVELLTYINEAIRAAISRKPSASVTTTNVLLQAGSLQNVPALCIVVQDINTNMGTDGITPGRAITLIDKATLNTTVLDWRSVANATVTKHWMYSPKTDPKIFHVYPGSQGTNYVEMTYSTIPVELDEVTDTIPLDDMYLNPIMEYVLFRCFEKDADTPNNQARATAHFQAFLQMLGAKVSTEAVQDPNIGRAPNVKE